MSSIPPVDYGVLRWLALKGLYALTFALVLLMPAADRPGAWATATVDAGFDGQCPDEDEDDEECVRGGAYAWPYQEYADRLRSAQEVSPLSSDLMGESVNLHDGNTTFTSVDIDVPGNGLSVQLRRRLSITRLGVGEEVFGGFSNWDVDVPYVAATLPASNGWSGRCSTFFQPPATGDLWLVDFWSGTTVHVPGGIDSELYYLESGLPALYPSDGQTYRWTTSDYSVLRCEGSGTGETFHMTTPEGTKYTFDTLRNRHVTTLRIPWMTTHGFTNQTRLRRYLLASKVEDRYGNRVEYFYNDRGYPTRIRSLPVGEATADRQIDVTYDTNNRVISATAHGRTWTYEYTSGLRYVNLPTDADIPIGMRPRWSYEYLGTREIQPQIWDGNSTNCESPPNDSGYYEVRIDHPGGAHGTFVFDYHRLARTGIHVNDGCANTGGAVPRYKTMIPYFADNFALQTKTLTGAGLPTLNWQYNYDAGPPIVGGQGLCNSTTHPCSAQPAERWVQVTEPDLTKKKYRFGVKYDVNFGRLLRTETHAASGTSTLLASTETVYYSGVASPFRDRYGVPSGTNQDIHQRIRPVTSQSETRQGVTFTASTLSNQFDEFARPKQVTRSSSLGSRTETMTYVDKRSTVGGAANVWILGRIGTVTVSGISAPAEAYTYHPDTLDRATETRFDKLQRTLGWHADGMLYTVTDGASQQTKLENYYRGVPGKITYADGTSQQAGINAFGQVTWVINEVGYTTSYGYTADGRLSSITYPAGDTVAWTPTTVSFAPTTDSSLGVSGTHWRQTITTDTGRKTVDFDALWRPVTTREEDTGTPSTRRYVTRDFDHAGRETFVSYPSTAISTNGTLTEYDALGRPRFVRSDSELGPLSLVTQIEYLGGFEKKVTDPLNNVTTTKYQAFDVPSEDAPIEIEDGIGKTLIGRDVLGKPLTMSRSGNYTYPGTTTAIGVSRTTQYAYDDHQRLCKIYEPESRATLLAYDLADNIRWRATGQPDAATCVNVHLMPQVAELTYDFRNRLKNSLFSDPATPNIYRTYTNDGLLSTVESDGSFWSYGYNRRRLPTTETLTLTGLAAGTWSITHHWNARGHRQSLQYPDGSTVDYDPNGLGQPRNVRNVAAGINYATAVTYHPTGAIAGFNYGNGIVHAMTPNARGLPAQWNDGTAIVRDAYVWDKNGNLTGLTDTRPSMLQTRTRSIGYDARDRLTSMTTAYNSRTFSYTYDSLDNLRTTSASAGGRNLRHDYASDGRLTRLFDPANASLAVIAYSYDDRGNATSRTSAIGFIPNTTSIVPDTANRVRSMTTGGSIETFTYDGHGRRTRATTSFGTLVHFYTQAGQLLFWENPATPTTQIKSREYNVYLGDRRIAQQTPGGRFYIHTDHIGSLLARTDTAGSLLESAPIWEAWGAPVSGYSSARGLRFAGHYTDGATGLSYMQQRYYDPYAGRFLAVDPEVTTAGNFNRYWYANNNPYRYIDPDGRAACADKACKTATIDSYPGRSTQSPTVNGNEGIDTNTLAGQQLVSGNDAGPEVSPRFRPQRQHLTSIGSGNKCAHGAAFEVTKPKKD